jgi:hypothetical protein
MTETKPPARSQPSRPSASNKRQQALQKQLRANLQRRKKQAASEKSSS